MEVKVVEQKTERKVCFVDIYQAVYKPTSSIAIPKNGNENDWQMVASRAMCGDLGFWPDDDAVDILDRAEVEQGFEIFFITEQPNLLQMFTLQLLRQDALLRIKQQLGAGVKANYNLYGVDGRRRYEFKPVRDAAIASPVWKASIIGAIDAGEVVYIGGQETREFLNKQFPNVKTFPNLAEFEAAVSPLEGFFVPRKLK